MSFTQLLAFKKYFSLAMKIFEISKKFPKEEKYSLTDQIRRSSRSVSANISEAYRKRLYPKHFISKLSDSQASLFLLRLSFFYLIEKEGCIDFMFG